MIVRFGGDVVKGSIGTTVEVKEMNTRGTIDYDPQCWHNAFYFDGANYVLVTDIDAKKSVVDGDLEAYAQYLEEKRIADEKQAEATRVWYNNHYDAYNLKVGCWVIVTRGRKIPKGSSGLVKWKGSNRWGESVLVQPDNGEAFFVSATNVDVVPEWE